MVGVRRRDIEQAAAVEKGQGARPPIARRCVTCEPSCPVEILSRRVRILADPWFYAAAVPAVILVGLSKGGFGGAMGFVGVPLMALAMSPVRAAAILLPILVVMDIVSLWSWRGVYDRGMPEDDDARAPWPASASAG